MSHAAEIARLYHEAGVANKRARDLIAEWEGKDLPTDKEAEIKALLDDVDRLSERAQTLERAEAQEKKLAEPTNERSWFKETPEVKVKWNGREIEAEEIAELKAVAPFSGFFNAGDSAYEQYGKAFRTMLRKEARTLTGEQVKALSVGEAQAGGYLVRDVFLDTLLVKSREVSAMRTICNVLPPVPSGAVIVPAEDSVFTDAEWTTELGTGSEDTSKPFAQRRLTPHPLAKRVRVSNTLLRTPTFDVEAYVRDRMAYRFGVSEEDAFINGSGVGQPLGLLRTPNLPTVTTATSLTVAGDDLIKWVYSLPAAYAPRARILCNRAFLRKVRTLKTNDGQYLWQPGLQTGVPSSILDVPYSVSDRFDDGLDATDAWEANKLVAVVGDFGYYWIVDAMAMAVQRLNELYAETNQTGFIGRKESDGICVLPEAFVALKIKA